jgi:hypothetical protein
MYHCAWPTWLQEVTSCEPKGVTLVRVCACATGSWAISALMGPFHRKWSHQTSPEGLPLELEVTWVPLGYSLGRMRPIYRFLSLSLVICPPFPAIRGAPSIITQKFVVFGYVRYVLQVVYHVRVITVGVLNNLRVKWMKWYIWSPKSPNRRSPGHEILGLGSKWVFFVKVIHPKVQLQNFIGIFQVLSEILQNQILMILRILEKKSITNCVLVCLMSCHVFL